MTREVMWANPEDELQEVADMMDEQGVRHMPVLLGTELVGILSDRDILKVMEYHLGETEVPKMTVGEVMSRDLVTCAPAASIAAVAATMVENKIDALPVVQYGSLVGLITSTDMLEILSQSAGDLTDLAIPIQYKLRRFAQV
jgi:CBS domain-containing protein